MKQTIVRLHGTLAERAKFANKAGLAEEAENAETVNGKEVHLNILNEPISSLEASDDWDNN